MLLACGVSAGWAQRSGGETAAAPSTPSATTTTAAPTTAAPTTAKAIRVGQATFVRELGGISEYRLPNGLQVLLFPDDAQSTTTVNITYRVGSRHESPGEYGMAHLLEHLMFKGTPRHRDLAEVFARRGMRFNGTTTSDRTNYFSNFNADPVTLDFALSLEADRMLNSFIAKSDLDKEMTVVRNEFERGENEPFEVLSKRVQAAAYDWHNYGHDTIGPKSDIENVPIDKLQAFYKRYYRPDNATLMVAGRFDAKATLARISQLFSPLRNPATPVPRPYTVEPPQDGERTVVVRRVGGQPILLAYYHVPAMAHPDSAPLLVLGLMLSLQPSGQLYKELVEPKLALAAGLTGLGAADPGGIRAYAVLPPDADKAAVEQRLLDIVEGRSNKPFEASELTRVRELALMSYRDQMKNPEALIQQISSLGATDWRLLFQLMEDLPKVTLADVERVRQAYLRPANRTLGRYLPAAQAERVEIPAAPPLEARLAGLQGPPKVEEGERFDPTPEHLLARTVTRRLPSGMELNTLSKRTRGNTVQLEMQLRWGERNETFQRKGTDLVARLMDEGTPTLSKQALQDRLVQLRANLSISSGDQGATLRISAEKDSLLEVLKMAADLMQHPLLPQAAFDRAQKAGQAGLEAQRQELETLRQQAVREHYNRARGVKLGDPDYLMTTDEQVAQLKSTTLEDIKNFHARYWSANQARVAVVGAVPEGLDTALDQLFGHWKKPDAPAYVRDVPKADQIPAARFDAIARDKANAEMRWRLDFALNDRDPDYLPLMVAAHILGGGSLENRLSVSVRQKAGLSYGVRASMWAPHFGDDADLIIGGTFAPQNREQVLALVKQELERMGRDGITEAELNRTKTDLLEGLRQSRADDARLSDVLLTMSDQGETWKTAAEREAKLRALTVAQVNEAWRKRIKVDGFVISTVGDFKDKAP
ncbi:pitrilysin family protein [Roseateles sp. SL47]|uniref:M16 family metallopeptidase n=1 Tax=Roseateles sp. SL47 TaxID=2995138 RepID=UPI00226FB2DE|nr:pitrilysin family protein [Roseateles sp. SL47]WAC75973.1 pitrilysin family protein [Roseateles sp. SL47]